MDKGIDMETKRCRKCGQVKPIEEFSKDSRRKKDGRGSWCKACMAVANTAYRKADPEKCAASQSAWY